MRVKFLKNQSWNINGRIVSFFEGEIKRIENQKIVNDMLFSRYAVEIKEEVKKVEEVVKKEKKEKKEKSIYKYKKKVICPCEKENFKKK